MQIEFIKGAVTLFGQVEKGDIVTISEQSALSFIQAGLAKIPSKKSTAKIPSKKSTAKTKQTKPAADSEAEKADV